MAESIGKEMVASYSVTVTGIERTRRELERLDAAIHSLRAAQYSPAASVSVLSSIGASDIFKTKMDDLEGRIQTAATDSMLKCMDLGKRLQQERLRAAVTRTGLSGKSHTKGARRGPGRDDTGAMIRAVSRNVETYKATSETFITGWHGWGTEGRKYFPYQEKGTARIEGANSLGYAIPVVRETLKAELGKLKRS